MSEKNTQKLYDQQSDNWVRNKPRSLSDFTGRPPTFELLGNIQGKSILDLGCGEGYPARTMKQMGAAKIVGVDLSQEMVNRAIEQEKKNPLGIEYSQGDVRDLKFSSESFDLVTAIFVFNYINIADMKKVMKEALRVLKNGGAFVFSVPHPCFSFIWKGKKPFYFDLEGGGYFSSRDKIHSGEIYTIDDQALKVQKFHKTFEDFFTSLKEAGFTKMPIVKELAVKPEHIAQNPEFFSPIQDIPLHVAIRIEK